MTTLTLTGLADFLPVEPNSNLRVCFHVGVRSHLSLMRVFLRTSACTEAATAGFLNIQNDAVFTENELSLKHFLLNSHW